jgi:hypothetical protein
MKILTADYACEARILCKEQQVTLINNKTDESRWAEF